MSSSLSFCDVHDVESLTKVEALLGTLEKTLSEEVSAVARLDVEALTRLDAVKQEIVLELEACKPSSDTPMPFAEALTDEQRDIKHRVLLATGHVRAMIHANSALLTEAIAIITAKLGIDSRPQSYDRRARGVAAVHRSLSRSV